VLKGGELLFSLFLAAEPVLEDGRLVGPSYPEAAKLIEGHWEEGAEGAQFVDVSLIEACCDVFLS
jgi:hypothetical protein